MNANSNLNTRLKCSTPNCEPKNWTHISLKNKESLLIVELDEFGDLKLNYFGHLQLSPSLKIVLSMWSILVCCSYDVTCRMWLRCDVELAPLPALLATFSYIYSFRSRNTTPPHPHLPNFWKYVAFLFILLAYGQLLWKWPNKHLYNYLSKENYYLKEKKILLFFKISLQWVQWKRLEIFFLFNIVKENLLFFWHYKMIFKLSILRLGNFLCLNFSFLTKFYFKNQFIKHIS